jgi:hypothetical protein
MEYKEEVLESTSNTGEAACFWHKYPPHLASLHTINWLLEETVFWNDTSGHETCCQLSKKRGRWEGPNSNWNWKAANTFLWWCLVLLLRSRPQQQLYIVVYDLVSALYYMDLVPQRKNQLQLLKKHLSFYSIAYLVVSTTALQVFLLT